MKSLYDAINRYWAETETSPLPPSASALYHFLCYKANRQRWEMPVKCSTELAVYCLQLTRPSICTARKMLAKRGFIRFVDGKRKGLPAEYFILDKEGDMECKVTPGLTPNLTHGLTPSLTPDLTPNFTPINDKKNKKEEKENSSPNNAREEKISLDELEGKLSADEQWLQSVAAFIATCGFGTLDTQQVKDHLGSFFKYLRAKGQNEREENDTRSYFNNWLKLHLKNTNNNGNSNNTKVGATDRRRPLDINTSSAKNYHTSF